jgi:hypothetical protein
MRALGVVTAFTVMASPVGAQAPPSADSAAIVRLELELTHLLETGQFDRYAEHLTDDYALTAGDGQLLSRAEALAQWRARGPGTRMTPRGMWVRLYGDAAVLTAEVVSGGPDGTRHPDHQALCAPGPALAARRLAQFGHWRQLTPNPRVQLAGADHTGSASPR